MLVVSQRNIILPGPNGEKFNMPKGFMGTVPAWAEKSAYLKALAADGKVIISASSKDKDIETAGKRRGKGKPDKPAESTETETASQPDEEQVEDVPAGEQVEGV